MPVPTSLVNRPGRAAATAGALLATSAAVAMAVAVGTAAADGTETELPTGSKALLASRVWDAVAPRLTSR